MSLINLYNEISMPQKILFVSLWSFLLSSLTSELPSLL